MARKSESRHSIFPSKSKKEVDFFDFKRYFSHTPTALCIRECVRLAKLKSYPCKEPILDVGCGDGLFASIAFNTQDVWGIDVDANEGRWAQASQAYSQIVIGDISNAKLPEDFFNTCVANCSLEHIPDLPAALEKIYRSMAPGGMLYFFVPTYNWAEALLSVRLSKKMGMKWLSEAISSTIDGVFRHYHLYDREQWIEIAEDAGFEVVEASEIGTAESIRAFEAYLIPSIIGYLVKKISGRWILMPHLRSSFVFPVFLSVQALLGEMANDDRMAEYFLYIRKPNAS